MFISLRSSYRSKEKRQSQPRSETRYGGVSRQAGEYVDENDDDACALQNVGNQRDRGQVLQVSNPSEKYQRNGVDDHVDANVPIYTGVIVNNLFQILADEDRVHATEAVLCDADEGGDCFPTK